MLRTILACVLIGLIPGIAAAACGPIPFSYPVLSGNNLEVGKDSTVSNDVTSSDIYGGKRYEGSLDAVNASDGTVISVSPTYPTLEPASFPSTGSTNTSAASVAAGSYKDITVAPASTTTFTGGTYYIDKLVVGKSATVNLAAGRYFIDHLSLGNNARIVVSSGPVQIYIGSEVSGGDNLSFNAAGAVAGFQVLLYPGADWQVDKDVTFVGVIYAPGASSKIEFDDHSSIRGALVTAGAVKLGQDTSLYFNAADQAAVGAVNTCAAPVAAPSGFNAFETGTATGSVSGVIRTKVAASAFNLDVVALKAGGTAVETAFAGDVKLELVDASSASCGAYGLIRNLGTLTFAAADLGRKTLSGISEANAWPNARIRMTYPATGVPTITACSTDNFAIRPASFGGVTVSDTDSVSAGSVRTLTNTAASGGNVHKAGRPFRMVATASNGVGVATANYAGTPAASVTACVLPGAGCTLGALTAGTWSAAAGTVTTTGASYAEVGAVAMKLVDTSFAAVDAADGSSAAEMTIESAAFNVGRFVPDHFELTTASTPRFKTFNDTACATRSFTYVGQPFGYLTLPQSTITAKNAAGATTLNYAGALWKLAAAGATQTYAAVTGTLDTGLVGTPAVSEAGSGVGSLIADAAAVIAFVRTTPVVPFSADISLSMSIQDSAENGIAGNGIIATATPALFSSMAFDAGNDIRYGQLVVSNAHGSELLGLPVPIDTRFWNGSGFVRNTADFCTQLAAANVLLANWRRDLNACETSVLLSGRFNAGRGNLRLSAPGAGNTGSVDLTLQLGATATGSSCVAGGATAAVAASQSWLQGRWSGGAFDQNPAARASFGLYRGSKSLIYLREMY